jgi:hypothetical protein
LYVLFEDASKFFAGRILSEADTSLQLELDSGKRVKVKSRASADAALRKTHAGRIGEPRGNAAPARLTWTSPGSSPPTMNLALPTWPASISTLAAHALTNKRAPCSAVRSAALLSPLGQRAVQKSAGRNREGSAAGHRA